MLRTEGMEMKGTVPPMEAPTRSAHGREEKVNDGGPINAKIEICKE